MSITEKNKIDFVSTRKSTGDVILTISDHLDWEDTYTHLKVLQDKLNAYIKFIEGGQIFDEYPNSKGKRLIIEIVSKEDYNNLGMEFLDMAKPIVESVGAELLLRTTKKIG